jgi:hypothetical protein
MFLEVGFYGEIQVPANKNTGAGEVTGFFSAIAKSDLPA